jgi:hypothetical protein
VKLDITVVSFLTQSAVPGVTVTACAAFAPTCDLTTVSDENGVATFVLPVIPPTRWSGFFRLSAPGYRNMLALRTKPLATDDFATMFIVTEDEFIGLVTQFGVPHDPTKAMVFATAFDCKGFNAPGITFKQSIDDPGILTSYFTGAAGPTDATNKSGTVGFVNVPATDPYVTVSAFKGAELVAESFVPIEADWITVAGLYPQQ